MIKAYFDESGIDSDQGSVVVAGFLARFKFWKRFEKCWLRTLGSYGLGGFHAKDFYSAKPDGSLKGPYAHLNPSESKSLEDELVETVSAAQKLRIVGAVVDCKAFFDQPETARQYLTGARLKKAEGEGFENATSGAPSKPYFCAFQHVIIVACRAARPKGREITFIFDQQPQYSAWAAEVYTDLKGMVDPAIGSQMGTVTFADHRETPALQLADWLVFLLRRKAEGLITSRQQLALETLASGSKFYSVVDVGPKLLSKYVNSIEQHPVPSS